jgi:hypothetical protein
MGADDRAIDVVPIPSAPAARFGVRLDGVNHRRPEAGPLPAGDATGHRAPGTIAFGQIAPGGARAQHPSNAVQEAAMVHGWPASLGLLGWEQRLQMRPLGIG